MAGASKKKIDWEQVERAAQAGANGKEIAAMLGVHYDTLVNHFKEKEFECGEYSNFSDYLSAKRSGGDALLKVKQFSMAMKGDRGMCIWLGKNRLGQSDKVDNNNINVEVDPAERAAILQRKIAEALEAKKKREED